MNVARSHFYLDRIAESILTSPERPILLVPKKKGGLISGQVAPGLGTVGVMLPYTPLHHMLLNNTRDKILIMTSGNEHNKPMCTTIECARKRLRGIADYFLHHNRRIVNRVDDSVVRFTAGRVTMLRRGRGYAPAWIRLPSQRDRPVIAFGAELQTSGAVGFSDKVVLTQYIGDTDELENLEFLERMLRFFTGIYGIDPEEAILVADMHPSYTTRKLAERWADLHGSELKLVQHHHAHITSVMSEMRVRPGEEVVGIAIDGLGYGDDGTLWGGEVLVASYEGYKRIGHLRPQPMPGGDRASKYPVRMLIGMLSTFLSESEIREVLREKHLMDKLPGGEMEVE
ncbi:MAG: Sua5/YciO/YrdC/YwlC family protein [Candidatus Korarchaeota archaeon]|nr:Sua5/YciO/YrdC/YwlC family protein [Candidatus Korarchaeota archaeon]